MYKLIRNLAEYIYCNTHHVWWDSTLCTTYIHQDATVYFSWDVLALSPKEKQTKCTVILIF